MPTYMRQYFIHLKTEGFPIKRVFRVGLRAKDITGGARLLHAKKIVNHYTHPRRESLADSANMTTAL